jgi:hypothetical protein
MTCHHDDTLLDDYLEGVTPVERADEMRAFVQHLDGCAHCQALVRDVTLIRDAARTLPVHALPAGTWARIDAAIQSVPERASRRAWLPLAAAAVITFAVVALDQRGAPALRATAELASLDTIAETLIDEHDYEGAIDRLQAIAPAAEMDTDPALQATVRAGLDTLDRAIADARDALARQPESIVARQGLMDALDTKVALLQDSVTLMQDTMP